MNASELLAEARRRWRSDEWQGADELSLPLLRVASLSQLEQAGHLGARGSDDELFAVMVDRRPDWLGEWAAWLVEEWPQRFRLVRRLVREELIERPDTDAYVVGLIATDPAVLLDDEALLDHEVWRLFEVEGGGENSLAAREKYRADWSGTLLLLAAEGLLDRARLLDASLEALARDFAAFRAGWFSRFHEALEPTPDERAARVDAYLALLRAAVPATVSFALKALAKAGPLDRPHLAEDLEPALASDRKTTVTAALRLLGGAPPEEAARAALTALVHEDADVQRRALDVIERGLTDDVRARLGEHGSTVAASLRDRTAALAGDAAAAPPARGAAGTDRDALRARADALPDDLRALAGVDAPLDTAIELDLTRLPLLAGAEPIVPVDDVDELLVLLSRWVEEAISAEDAERAMDALARLCDRPVPEAARALAGRAAAHWTGSAVRALVETWVDGATEAEPVGHAAPRVVALTARIAARDAGPLLAPPTHRGGWLAPEVFAERRAARTPDPADLVAARCRLPPDHPDAIAPPAAPSWRIEPHRWSAKHHELHVEPPAPVEGLPATYLGHHSTQGWYDQQPLHGLTQPTRDSLSGGPGFDAPSEIDELVLLHPAASAAYWGQAARSLANSQDFPSPDGDIDAQFFAAALDPDRNLGPTGALALAFGLNDINAITRAAAVEAAAAGLADGRLGAAMLGAHLHAVLAGGMGFPNRLGPALADLAHDHPEPARLALEHAVALDPAPRGFHALLSVLDELAADAGAALTHAPARTALGQLTGSGKAAKLARSILERDGTSRHAEAARAAALEGRIARAERWAATRR